MTEEPQGSVSQLRQLTIDALVESFANDAFEVEEFERRIDQAHAATTSDELRALLRDVPKGANVPAIRGGQETAAAMRMERSPLAAAHVKEREFAVAVMGGGGRRGSWTPARTNYAVAIMGGQELDFREAVMPPGVTDVQVFTMWGGVEIIVPPEMHVESHGIALLGGFEHLAQGAIASDPNAPKLRITGVAIMGGVEITVRHPGETARDARQRRRLEGRERRRLRRGG